MNGAIVLLVINAAVAGMFALCYGLIALINKGQRAVMPFGISYLIGMLTPLSELGVRWSHHPAPFMIVSYTSLLGGFLAMAAALNRFERRSTRSRGGGTNGGRRRWNCGPVATGTHRLIRHGLDPYPFLQPIASRSPPFT